ncbi:MAG: electron transport complex subunit RsxC [Clostridia bacterium]|nr:electron transport complex subunit RsxC [Clostridia bacterium]
MAFYLKGVKLSHKKNTSPEKAEKISVNSVTIPMSMHIGRPANAVVKKGDTVAVGSLIGEAAEGLSSPVYSSVSGSVQGVGEILLSNGMTGAAVTIESDGEMTLDSSITPPTINNRDDLINALSKSGIVGLGGAGFPTSIKFKTDKPIEYLIINSAECEPYITSDNYTMLTKADMMEYAIETLVKFFGIKKVIIGIEKNKPKAIAKMRELSGKFNNASVKVLPTVYPQGGEKVMVYHTTGKVVAEGGLPIDVGCVVCNCTTVAEIGKYLKTGIPLVEKVVTVDGDAIENPQNVIAPIGAPIKDVLEFCGIKAEIAKALYGGPMMGISVTDLEKPVLKNTNALLAFSQKQAFVPKTTACIRCGACANNCPFGIDPVAILKSYKEDDYLGMKKAGALLCMECGCCSYVCPAKIPNVQNNKLAKEAIRKEAQREVK